MKDYAETHPRSFISMSHTGCENDRAVRTYQNQTKHVMKRDQLTYTRKGDNAVVMRAKLPKVSGAGFEMKFSAYWTVYSTLA